MDINKIVTKAVREVLSGVDWEDIPALISGLESAKKDLEDVRWYMEAWMRNHESFTDEFFGSLNCSYAEQIYTGIDRLMSDLQKEIKYQKERESKSKSQGG